MARQLTGLSAVFHAIVLVAFLLPFYDVSCQGRPLASATGYEVATGHLHPAPEDLPRVDPATPADDPRPPDSIWLFAVPALAVAAAVLCALAAARAPLAPRRELRTAAMVSAAAGIAAAAAVLANYSILRAHLRRVVEARLHAEAHAASAESLGRGLSGLFASGITLEVQVGWVLALACALVAAVLAFAALLVSAPAQAQAPPPS